MPIRPAFFNQSRARRPAKPGLRALLYPIRRSLSAPISSTYCFNILWCGYLVDHSLPSLSAPGEFQHRFSVAGLCRGGAAGGAVCLPGGVVASREYGALSIGRTPPKGAPYLIPLREGAEVCAPPLRLRFRAAVVPRRAVRGLRAGRPGLAAVWGAGEGWPLVERLSLDAIGAAPLAVRNRRPGDRYRPLGAAGTRSVKEIMIDGKVPARLRGVVPLLVRGEEILWLPGHRIADGFKVTPSTRRILEVTVEKTP